MPDPVAVVVDSFGAQCHGLPRPQGRRDYRLTSVVLVRCSANSIFYAMARDGLLPKIFSRVHPRFHTPYINTILVGTITAVAAGFFDINVLGDMTSVGTLAAFAIVCLSVIYLRRAAPDLPRGFSVPLYPVVPILGNCRALSDYDSALQCLDILHLLPVGRLCCISSTACAIRTCSRPEHG